MVVPAVTLHWYACSEPERPTDPYVVWHYATGGVGWVSLPPGHIVPPPTAFALPFGTPGVCGGCALKIEVVRRLYPDDPHIGWLIGKITGVSA